MSHLLIIQLERLRKLTAEFNNIMNSKVEYRKKNSSWGSVLLLKARELNHQFVGKRKRIEFSKPVYAGKEMILIF
jgi:CRISPR-associated protein Cas1